jgi:hypothetical protein
MLFELKNGDAAVHVGVQEFIAPEGVCAIPTWMWYQLSITAERQHVTVTQVKLPKGVFVKFKPLQAEFMQTHNPKAILEKHLRGFAALTMGMVITLYYGGHSFCQRFDLEVKTTSVYFRILACTLIRIIAQVVELHDKSGQVCKGEGVSIVNVDIGCAIDIYIDMEICCTVAPASGGCEAELTASSRAAPAVCKKWMLSTFSPPFSCPLSPPPLVPHCPARLL